MDIDSLANDVFGYFDSCPISQPHDKSILL